MTASPAASTARDSATADDRPSRDPASPERLSAGTQAAPGHTPCESPHAFHPRGRAHCGLRAERRAAQGPAQQPRYLMGV
eukprot:307665-Prymnesium_polylepis.1